MDRRTFLKVGGAGALSLAAACKPEAQKHLYTMVRAPLDQVTGTAAWYATTCRECPAGCGLLAKVREQRIIKVEGNPQHPINRGRLCIRGQAILQGIYHPDRIKTPLVKDNGRFRSVKAEHARQLIVEKVRQAAARGPGRIAMVTETIGDHLYQVFSEMLLTLNSQRLLVFEPFAYEALKTANEKIFGIKGLPTYRMEEADLLVSLGADFLETWLSPVEYARKFKKQHAADSGGRKGFFVHIAPFQSLTGANADQWVGCTPGAEVYIALAMIHQILARHDQTRLSTRLTETLVGLSAPYSPERVAGISGVTADMLKRLAKRMLQARRPLILGTTAGGCGPNTLQANLAANLLNLILDPALQRIDFTRRQRVETAASRADVMGFLKDLDYQDIDVLLVNNADPVFSLAPGSGIAKVLGKKSLFVVSFGNFMDDTTRLADLVLPVRLPLESWDEYGAKTGLLATLQPVMEPLTGAPHLADLMERLRAVDTPKPKGSEKQLYAFVKRTAGINSRRQWVDILQQGGCFDEPVKSAIPRNQPADEDYADALRALSPPATSGLSLIAAPSLRFFDGRGANRPWLNEIPDPLTKTAWQTPVQMHPDTMDQRGLSQGDMAVFESNGAAASAPVYQSSNLIPGVLVVEIGQGHAALGRYGQKGAPNPFALLPAATELRSGGPSFYTLLTAMRAAGKKAAIVHTDGSRFQHGRPIARTIAAGKLAGASAEKHTEGLTMGHFPLTLPLPAGYTPSRDFYPPHSHENYRWVMVVDLDRCIGCGACAAACYAENNLAVVGRQHMLEGREMSWLRIERYLDPERPEHVTFLPMMCQHCDDAPCESVCPVYAPHHSKEGLNNQIYNRCIGTRFCSQNCPYKVRRFNWFDWQRPRPLPLQLNPDVTVRAKGVMEKCSFCVQRIKAAHGHAKNEKRDIGDGEVIPACVQTCPTAALTFGNLMDKTSRVRRLTENPRAYQVMGYLNAKPAVIYLKKVIQEI